MDQGLLGTVEWDVILGIVLFVAMCVGVAIAFTQFMKWNTISFADILRDYSKLILITVLAGLVIGGGLLWVSNLATTEVGNVAPGIQQAAQLVNARGTTVVVATHDRELIRRVGRRSVTLDHGHIVEVA